MKLNKKYQLGSLENAFEDLFSPFFRLASEWISDPTFENYNFKENSTIRATESNETLRLEFLVPGWSKPDLKLEYTSESLSLKGSRKDTSEEQDSWLQNQLNLGVRIGSNWNVEKAVAKLSDGILTITIPKKDSQKTKTLKIG